MECFVIMPFGEKVDANGRVTDFDKVYQHIIRKSIESLGINCVRCDEIAESGWIHSKMFDLIYRSQVAVVDITSLNPNVFYELGIRHALADRVTVIIRREGTKLPFNIQDFSVIDYDPEDLALVDNAIKKISDFIRNGLKLGRPDSPVHHVLKIRVHTEAARLQRQEIFKYKVNNSDNKNINIITGELQNVRKIADVWVSSENINMEMSRHFERSVSGVIRYLGAKKNAASQVVDDTIANELRSAVGGATSVPLASVIVTSAGELTKTHGVKKIFHAATVVGKVGTGYSPIADIETCVTKSLEIMDSEEFSDAGLKTILFPLMGTGQGRGSLEDTAKKLIDAAISYLSTNPKSCIEKVYFIALTDRELSVCQRILQLAQEVSIEA